MGRSSIGIVTFGSGQMDEIGRVLEQRLEKEPHLVVESKIKSCKEPLFIKNLESIQGEERSIIISVGYGRDKSGKLVMNFGPLNQSRGWRRLNVAISRARDRMIVCSSIHSSDIAVTEKTGKSILELKGFLEYAETGRFDRKISSADVIDPILPAIADKVRALGYEVALNIGKSELRIDIAVVDPDNRDSYCLAILLDRNLYDNFRNPVDRDYTKYRFLKKMGWNVLRVYTLDWLTDEDFVMDMIKDNLPKRRTGPYRRIRGVRY